MMDAVIPISTGDALLDCAIDTIKKTKQAIVFVNTKKGAEKEAESIAAASRRKTAESGSLAEQVLNALPKQTSQCQRLSTCVLNGIAFHHAGLPAKQRELVEQGFRDGHIRVICATPTLAAGVDLPAFRAIIRDLKRYTAQGYVWIPVLEYLQMAGRAGRPKYDEYGEAIFIAKTEAEAELVTEKYVRGSPEAVLSKLAVEPVLRTHLLSLIATAIIHSHKSVLGFFAKTLYAFQFGDTSELERILQRQLERLVQWEFIKKTEHGYTATPLGERIAQLYLDPLTAYTFILAIEKAGSTPNPFALLHCTCQALEMRPLLRVKQKEYADVQTRLSRQPLLQEEPDSFDDDYSDWLNAGKTAILLECWADEVDEETLLDRYDARPGETRTMVERAQWLLYCLGELARLTRRNEIVKHTSRLATRLKYGIKEELLSLIKLDGVGRVRARKLYSRGYKDIGDLKSTTLADLGQVIGMSAATSIKRQLGDDIPEPVPEGKRKGQMGLAKYTE